MRISDWSSDVCSSDLFVFVVFDLRTSTRRRADVDGDVVEQSRSAQPGGAEHAGHPLDRRLAEQRVAHFQIVALDGGHLVDRKSVVSGQRVSVRLDLGGRRIIQQKTTRIATYLA